MRIGQGTTAGFVRIGSVGLLAAGVVLLVGFGCGRGEQALPGGTAWTGTIDTTAHGRVVVTNTGGGAWRDDTIRARQSLVIGEAGISDGSEAIAFGEIIGLAVDTAGRVYVGDRLSNTVRAYGPDGRQLGLVGREGQGPGEFQWPDGLAFGPDGRLYVAESDGITVMTSPGDGSLPTEQVDQWPTVPYMQVFRPFRLACDGTVYYPHREGDPSRDFYLRYRRDGTLRDTVRVPRLAGLPSDVPYVRTGPGGGGMISGVDHVPLAPIPSWDVTPDGRLLLGEARRYRLRMLAPDGDTLRTVRRDVDRRPISEPVRRESADALRTRLDTLPVPVGEVRNLPSPVADVELPARYPSHLIIRVGTAGRIWVERAPLRGQPGMTPYDVFDRSGVYLGTLVIPVQFDSGRGFTNGRMRPRPVFTDSAVYGVVADSVTGVQQVARFSYELPDREAGAPPAPAAPCAFGSRKDSY